LGAANQRTRAFKEATRLRLVGQLNSGLKFPSIQSNLHIFCGIFPLHSFSSLMLHFEKSHKMR